jgi:hypothetical protein
LSRVYELGRYGASDEREAFLRECPALTNGMIFGAAE